MRVPATLFIGMPYLLMGGISSYFFWFDVLDTLLLHCFYSSLDFYFKDWNLFNAIILIMNFYFVSINDEKFWCFYLKRYITRQRALQLAISAVLSSE
jgi:hypothetical protein